MAPTIPSAPGAQARAQAAPRYGSVCTRNMQKIEDTMRRENLLQYAASNDLWLLDVNDYASRIYEPCASYDARAADQVDRNRREAARIRAHCAQSRPAYDCTPWGYDNQDANRRWFDRWMQEVRQALSNPEYSADLGPAAGPGGGADPGGVAGPPGPVGPTPDERCNVEMQDLGAEMREAQARLPPDGTVARLELVLWYVDASLQAIQQLCPQSPNYAVQRDSFRQTRRDVQSTCDALSTRRCSARRPG